MFDNGKTIQVKFWGTRGSIPTPGKYALKYGGNTPCIEIRCGETILILDAGTGMRELGASLLQEFMSVYQDYHVLISHTHWDHIQGFPFFSVAYLPTSTIHFYGGHGVSDLEKLIFEQMDREYFPVSLFELASDIKFKTTVDNPFFINDVKIYFTHLIHPAMSLGYRIEYDDKVIVYATDCEISDDPELIKVNAKNLEMLMQDADVLIADCQYTETEYQEKKGWGHTSIDRMVDIAGKHNVKNLFAFHHDPLHTDDDIDNMIINAQQRALSPMKVYGAKEKSRILL